MILLAGLDFMDCSFKKKNLILIHKGLLQMIEG